MAKRPREDVTEELFAFLTNNLDTYVERLSEFVAIPSVSAEADRRPECVRAVEWYKSWCEKLGGHTQMRPNPLKTQQMGSETVELPPILLAEFGGDPKLPTLLVYGHLDVQPAALSDGWNTEPFVLTEKAGLMYGRGSTDDKGPVCAWLWVIEAHKKLDKPLPVNIRLIAEAMEESGSIGLSELVRELAFPGGYLDPKVIDHICISDNYYVGNKPCLTHGLRGNCYFEINVRCSTSDLHSGVFGGSIHEAMTDLVKIMSTLIDSSGKILIEGLEKDVAPLGEGEIEALEAMDFDLDTYKSEVGVRGVSDKLLFEGDKAKTLMSRWRYPTCSLHGIEGAFDGPGAKTVIPRNVTGKFSIRLVPNMEPDKVKECVEKYVKKEWAKLHSPNPMTIEMTKGSFPWYRDPNADNFLAARRATMRVHGVEPQLTREGGSIPITLELEAVTGAVCVMFPIGASDDMAHAQNEKLGRANYLNGMKCLGAYVHELAALTPNT
eukprot:gene21716-26118_t